MISDNGQFYFFHNPKAAGTSICRLLETQSKYSCTRNDNNSELSKFLRSQDVLWANHAHPRLIRDFLGKTKYSNYFKFTFVRDPRERLVSLYSYIRQKEREIYEGAGVDLPPLNREVLQSPDFETWLLNSEQLPVPQMDFFSTNGEFLLDFVGRTENVQGELRKIQSILGIDELVLPQTNESKHKPAREYFTIEMNDIVANKYKIDFEFFGYNID